MTAASPSPCTVLIVEDDPDIRDALVDVLNEEGYCTLAAGNGRVALEALARQPVHLILLDLMMPVMNGWEFREEQRRVPAFASVPVIIISADASASEEVATLGAQAFLRKPVELQELLAQVRKHARLPAAS